MNRSRAKGVMLTLLGKCQRSIGKAIGNPRLVHLGQLRVIEGRTALAIGEAQALIQRCLAQRAGGSRAVRSPRVGEYHHE